MAQPLPAGKLVVGTRWRYSDRGLHAAFDYRVGNGTPVFAVANGVVLACNDGVSNRPRPGVTGAPSNWVLLGITHAGRKASVLYQHLSPGLNVTKGQRVRAGHQLGKSGSSGNATGPHLHLATMWGHRDTAGRYDYMKGIGRNEGAPQDGTASNEICIFPPSLVFDGGGSVRPFDPSNGLVFVNKLRFGTTDSDSVRRLQFVLNGIRLQHGRNLRISGNYDIDTKNEATKWQIQKDACKPGTPGADGNIGPRQAQRLFGPKYVVRAHS